MKRVQLVGSSEATIDAMVGLNRELTIVEETKEIRVHDGVTPGGHRIPTEAQIVGFNYRFFNGVQNHSTPGALPDDIQGKYATISVDGTYDMPLLSAILNVGGGMFITATVASVILETQGADVFNDKGAVSTTLALTQDETVLIAKRSSAAYVVLLRY